MKTLFTELYNRILELFQTEKSENTSVCAANRLQVILMHDRTKLDPLIMNRMREELISVFSKYVVIDREKLEIDLKNEGDAAALMLNIPIIRAKTETELNELRNQIKTEEENLNSEKSPEFDADYTIVEETEPDNAQKPAVMDERADEDNTGAETLNDETGAGGSIETGNNESESSMLQEHPASI